MANILFQQESYKRGMVLGLTMAEVVLLILFTLLLVLSALLIDKEREQAKLAAQIALVEKEFSKLVNGQISDPKKFFQELVIAKDRAAQADRLEKQLQEPTKQNAELKTALVDKVAPRILQIAVEYPDVDVIEVIGHTDEQVIRRRFSNLDGTLIDALKTGNVASLVPGDNAGLGISRAIAVVTRLLQDSRLQERFSRILPMSAAQLIQVDETLSQGSAGDVRERRRIEIRLRKYAGPDTVIQGAPSR